MYQIVQRIRKHLLQAGIEEHLVNLNIARIEDDYLKIRHNYLESNEIVLIVGGLWNMGLALITAWTFPFAEVMLTETPEIIHPRIKDACKSLNIQNLVIDSTLNNISERLGQKVIGWCVVTLDMDFTLSELETLLKQLNIRQISGEVEDISISASSLRSILTRFVERYYFRVYSSNIVVYGRGLKGQIYQNNKPDVSVIVPVYNAGRYLPYCIASLVQSSNLNQEILIINDGSTDNSEPIAREFERSYSNIHVINKLNGGCASSRSEGLRLASGEYVGFVDSDDWIDQGMYDDLYDSALTYQSDIAYSGFRKIYEHQNQIVDELEYVCCSHGNCNGLVDTMDQLYYLQPSIWRSIFKRSFLEINGIGFPQQIRRFDDLYFRFVTLSMAKRVSFVPRIYYNYRLGQSGQDVAANDERLYIHFEIFDLLKEHVREWGDEPMEWQLKLVELGTHQWAFNKITPKLKWTYLKKAARNFMKNEYISFLQVPLHAYRHFPANHAKFATFLTLLGQISDS